MEAFNVGDVIAPHHGLRLFDKHYQSYIFLDTDVAIVLEAQKRVPYGGFVFTETTLLHSDGQIRQHAQLDPQLFKDVTAQ